MKASTGMNRARSQVNSQAEYLQSDSPGQRLCACIPEHDWRQVRSAMEPHPGSPKTASTRLPSASTKSPRAVRNHPQAFKNRSRQNRAGGSGVDDGIDCFIVAACGGRHLKRNGERTHAFLSSSSDGGLTIPCAADRNRLAIRNCQGGESTPSHHLTGVRRASSRPDFRHNEKLGSFLGIKWLAKRTYCGRPFW